jgi:hypothetical protein
VFVVFIVVVPDAPGAVEVVIPWVLRMYLLEIWWFNPMLNPVARTVCLLLVQVKSVEVITEDCQGCAAGASRPLFPQVCLAPSVAWSLHRHKPFVSRANQAQLRKIPSISGAAAPLLNSLRIMLPPQDTVFK